MDPHGTLKDAQDCRCDGRMRRADAVSRRRALCASKSELSAVVLEATAQPTPAGLLVIHVTVPATAPEDIVPEDMAKVLSTSEPAPSNLSAREKAAFAQWDAFYQAGLVISPTWRPQGDAPAT
jgi:hypothetical protein